MRNGAMNTKILNGIILSINNLMEQNKNYLTELDQQNGDGDLGISMVAGFKVISDYLSGAEEKDLGKTFLKCSGLFNEAAPSSLGTIISLGFMGMAKTLKGKEDASISEMSTAMGAGLNMIMEKANSKPGEKTILDALFPAIERMKNASPGKDIVDVCEEAAKDAANGSEKTKEMRAVHGRAAYYENKSIGILDGGSVVGKLIFEGITAYFREKGV
jgi:dihydroxyacetone kinase